MKKSCLKKLFMIAGIASIVMLSSCNSTNTSFKVVDNGTSKDKTVKKQFVLFKYGNIGDFVTIDESSLFTNNTLGLIKQNVATVVVDPKLKTAGYGSPYMVAYYYLFWDKEARQQLRVAIQNYLDDFSNKNLNRNNSMSNKAYGKIPVSMKWGTLSNSTPNNGSGDMLVGYTFKKKSPYFTILIYPVHNNFSDTNTTVDRESMTLNYFFTRSQLNELLSILTEEKIEDVISENSQYGKTHKKQVADEYEETDDSEDTEDYVEAEVR